MITPKAPWRGATYERLIQNVKYCLRRTLGKKVIDSETLYTILVDIEKIVNSRPISAIFETENYRALRPIDFLNPYEERLLIEGEAEDPSDPDFVIGREKDIKQLTKTYQYLKQRI